MGFPRQEYWSGLPVPASGDLSDTGVDPESPACRSSVGKESACSAGDPCSIPGLGRSPEEGNGYLLQDSCLENSMDREDWQVTESMESRRVSRTEPLLLSFIPACRETLYQCATREALVDLRNLRPLYFVIWALCFSLCSLLVSPIIVPLQTTMSLFDQLLPSSTVNRKALNKSKQIK